MKWHFAVLMSLPAMAAITAARASTDGCPVVLCSEQEESSWIFQPSYFSHDPDNGKRVAQYAPEPTSYARDDPTYLESGYRHYQMAIVGPDGSADRLHVVQTWGLGELIRPYGEWEFPYRAGATPYGPWGNPQGPWTLPFDSWQNPYGLLQHMPNPGWGRTLSERTGSRYALRQIARVWTWIRIWSRQLHRVPKRTKPWVRTRIRTNALYTASAACSRRLLNKYNTRRTTPRRHGGHGDGV